MSQLVRSIQLTRQCPVCRVTREVEMPEEAYKKWSSGQFIQVAWPEGIPAQREEIISGTHSECWDKMWKGLD